VGSFGLGGRTALVTGSTRGIGFGIADRLAAEGCSVVVNAPAADEVARVRDDLARTHPEVDVVGAAADVADEAAVAHMFGEVAARFGGLDILVNNAGIWQSTRFDQMESAEWNRVLGVHLHGFLNCSRRAVDLMAASGGVIVSISSVSDTRAHERAVAYDAAKGAILAGSRAMAVDLGPLGIRVNCVSPGPILTENWKVAATPESTARAEAELPLRRLGTPNDVAAAVCFLASDEASFVTGQTIYVDGGLTAQARPAGGQPT
jgi:NAD(P)-dependent dehydrogenase (short-subunit alcohol dehydrogenase family)